MEALAEVLKDLLTALVSAVGTAAMAVIMAYIPRICKIIGRETRAKLEEIPRPARFAFLMIVKGIEKKFPDLPGQEQKAKALERAKEQLPWLPIGKLDKGLELAWDEFKAELLDRDLDNE